MSHGTHQKLTTPRCAGTHGFPAQAELLRRLAELIPGNSPEIHKYRQAAAHLLPCRHPLLIRGEQGSGKSFLVDKLRCVSPVLAAKPPVTVSCPGLPDSLAASELFGHEKEAFTGATKQRIGLIESAAGGTVFLEEIGDLPLPVQAMLLRFLDSGMIRRVGANEEIPVSARVIAATNRNLEDMAKAGTFRDDLFSRLRTLTLWIPSLRALGDDILLLAHHLLATLRDNGDVRQQGFTSEAEAVLLAHSWPGNLRELQSVIILASRSTDAEIFDAPEIQEAIDLRSNPANAHTAGNARRSPSPEDKPADADLCISVSKHDLPPQHQRFLYCFFGRLRVELSRVQAAGNDRFDFRQLVERAELAAAIEVLGPRPTQKVVAKFFRVTQPTISRWLHETGMNLLGYINER